VPKLLKSKCCTLLADGQFILADVKFLESTLDTVEENALYLTQPSNRKQ